MSASTTETGSRDETLLISGISGGHSPVLRPCIPALAMTRFIVFSWPSVCVLNRCVVLCLDGWWVLLYILVRGVLKLCRQHFNATAVVILTQSNACPPPPLFLRHEWRFQSNGFHPTRASINRYGSTPTPGDSTSLTATAAPAAGPPPAETTSARSQRSSRQVWSPRSWL